MFKYLFGWCLFLALTNVCYAQNNELFNGLSIEEVEKLVKNNWHFPEQLGNKEACWKEQVKYDVFWIFEDRKLVPVNNECARPYDNFLNQLVIKKETPIYVDIDSLIRAVEYNEQFSIDQKYLIKIKIAAKLIETNWVEKALKITLDNELNLKKEPENVSFIEALNHFNNIKINEHQHNPKVLLKYIYKIESIAHILNSDFLRARVNEELAYHFLRIVEEDEGLALENINKASQLFEKMHLSKKVVETTNLLAMLYAGSDKDRALLYYQEALNGYKQLNEKFNVCVLLQNIGYLYFEHGDYKLALKYLHDAIDNLPEEEMVNAYAIYLNISEAYEALGDYKKALQYFRIFDELEYKNLNKERQKNVVESQEKFAIELKTKAFEEMQGRGNDPVNAGGRNTSRQFALSTLFSILLLILTVAVSINLVRKNKELLHNQKLATQRISELTLENEDKFIEAMDQGQKMERKKISQFLHDHIGNRLGTLKVLFFNQKSGYKTALEKRDIVKAYEIANNVHSEVRQLSHELLSNTSEPFELSKYLESLVDDCQGAKDIEVELVTYGIEIIPVKIAKELYLIAQEAVQNAMKHSGGDKIILSLQSSMKTIVLSVEDNGLGLSDNPDLSGIGMANMKERARVIQGDFCLNDKSPGLEVLVSVKI